MRAPWRSNTVTLMQGLGRALLVLVVAACGASLAGCGPFGEDKISVEELENGLEEDASLNTAGKTSNLFGLTFDIDCPDDARIERGAEFTCDASADKPQLPLDPTLTPGERGIERFKVMVKIGNDDRARITKVTPVE